MISYQNIESEIRICNLVNNSTHKMQAFKTFKYNNKVYKLSIEMKVFLSTFKEYLIITLFIPRDMICL